MIILNIMNLKKMIVNLIEFLQRYFDNIKYLVIILIQKIKIINMYLINQI